MSCCSRCAKKASDNNVKLLQCGVCHSVNYCSSDCQKQSWASHKIVCTKTATLALFKAIQSKDVETIQRLHKVKRVVNGKVPYTPTDFGPNANEMADWTPLHECVRNNDAESMQLIIDGGVANLSIVDGDGESPLFVAATNESPECLATLIASGANPNAMAQDGFTALMMASRSGIVNNVKLLLQAGADPHIGSDMFGRGALDMAQLQLSGQGMRMTEGETFESAQQRFRQVYDLLSTAT